MINNEAVWKGIFINTLITRLNLKSYLELGVAGGHSWLQITCDSKTGVDYNSEVRFEGVKNMTTDKYFDTLSSDALFDLVYIDACHEKHHVKKDFFNSWKHLRRGGLIIMHDINPPTLESTSQNAHGDCFELWMEFTKLYRDNLIVHTGGTTCGFPDTVGIWHKKNENIQETEIKTMDNGFIEFANNRTLYVTNFEMTLEAIVNKVLADK